jgi:hypothetical protein
VQRRTWLVRAAAAERVLKLVVHVHEIFFPRGRLVTHRAGCGKRASAAGLHWPPTEPRKHVLKPHQPELYLALAILANGQPVKDHVLPLQNGTLSFQTWFQRRGSAIKSQFVTGAPWARVRDGNPHLGPPYATARHGSRASTTRI